MKCHEFEGRLHRLLDDRQLPEADPQLAAHAASCEPCGQLLAGQRVLFSGLRHAIAPPAGQFGTRVIARYQAEPVEAVVLDGALAARRAWQVVGWVAATAAALALAVSIYVSSEMRQPHVAGSGPDGKSVASLPQAPLRDLAKNDSPSPSTRGSRPRSGSIHLIPRPIGGYGVAIADMASSLPEAVERIEQVERYAPGIRPIRVSFAMLWDALWRSIPGLGSGDPTHDSALFSRIDVRRLA